MQTSLGYLITYSLATDPRATVYRPHFPENSSVHTRRQSNFTGAKNQNDRILWGPGEGAGVREVSVRFRMVIRVDAGIEKALALDEELVVATRKPPAVQCIRWTPDSTGNQTSTELLSRMAWVPKKTTVVDMICDRPMNLSAWITSDGKAYAVQRAAETSGPVSSENADESASSSSSSKLFRGYCFHNPGGEKQFATKVAINARFSLIAVARADCDIDIYMAKDYVGNIPLSHRQKHTISHSTSGAITFLSYSPDGYCLFVGYEHGWATFSVFGKPESTSFSANREIAELNKEQWLLGVRDGAWIGGGSEILLISPNDERIWILEMARSAITGCYTAANISRTLMQTRDSIMLYRGYDLPDLATISADSSLWHHSQIPAAYLTDQWPIKSCVVSPDGRYAAVAGRRGLAHYSVTSGRWKMFSDANLLNSFTIRGGMCWYQHILVAAVEAGDSFEVRLYPREASLDSAPIHTERLPAPVVLIASSGDDSLLVYTYDNLLYHYIFTPVDGITRIVQVGQIAFHGIVRSPARVRGLSWILPDFQLNEGDPTKDVETATVIFLVDGKLVLLQPSQDEEGHLKYDMRIIAHNIEYFALMRDSSASMPTVASGPVNTPLLGNGSNGVQSLVLKDSLWLFDGQEVKAWPDVQDVLNTGPADTGRELPPTVGFAMDFYPLSIALDKAILVGVEPDLVQRRDVNFAFFRFAIRVCIALPFSGNSNECRHISSYRRC